MTAARTEPEEKLAAWLQRAARRAARQRLLRDLAWAATAMLALAAGYIGIIRLVQPEAVVAALAPLIVVVAVAIVVSVLARRWPRPSLAAVAAAADSRAALHDSLLSAHCFVHEARDAFQTLHLRRAAHLADGLDVQRLFPLELPRAAVAAAFIASTAGALVWMLPPPTESAVEAASAAAAMRSGNVQNDDPAGAGGADEPADAAQKPAQAALWKQIETLTRAYTGSSDGQSLAQAIAARDARAAARAVQDLKKPSTSDPARAAETPGEQMSDVLAQGILERLTALLQAEQGASARPAAAAANAERPTARLDSELRAEQEDAQRSASRSQSAGEDALNTALRALSRNSASGRDMVHGEAESADGGGRANLGGGAMGRRVGVSSAGAGEGDQPTGEVAPLPADDNIFGRRTERLAVQLRAVKVPEGALDSAQGRDEGGGTEEGSFAATRAQAASKAVQSVGEAAYADSEGVLDPQRTPLEYREALKRYTLARHRREPGPARSEDSVR
jgi:hypothetical protein